MEQTKCDIVMDLLPLYVDGVCSEESKKIVEEHLKHCEECKQFLENMQTEVNVSKDTKQRETDIRILKKMKKRIWIERLVLSVVVVCIAIVIESSCFFYSLKMQNMNDVVDLEEVSVVQDEEGNLWLERSGNASLAQMISLEFYTTEGEPVLAASKNIYNKRDKNATYQVRVVFMESSLNFQLQKWSGMQIGTTEERSKICDKEKLKQCSEIIIEQSNGTEKVLWEKE